MTSWLVAGAGGQVGAHVLALLGRDSAADVVVGLARDRLDITDRAAVDARLEELRPDIVINTAAWTDVDGAETAEAAATRVNGDGPAWLAAGCRRLGARMVHVSTDYVFDGTAHTPYDEDAPVRPRSAYGRSKAAGERAVLAEIDRGLHGFLVRTAWVYGGPGPNFFSTMARLANERDPVDVVADQVGQPTWSADLAGGLVTLARSGAAPGTYHCTNAGEVSWFGFAQAIFRVLGHDPARVRPVSSEAVPRPAPRPAYSVLAARRWRAAGLPPMRPWPEALADASRASVAPP